MNALKWTGDDSAIWSVLNSDGDHIATVVGTWFGAYRGFYATSNGVWQPVGEYDTFEEARAEIEKRIAEQEGA
jgi:hypothetical protein